MPNRAWPPAECKCDFGTYMLGAGCQHCNPDGHEEILRGNEAEFEDETDGE